MLTGPFSALSAFRPPAGPCNVCTPCNMLIAMLRSLLFELYSWVNKPAQGAVCYHVNVLFRTSSVQSTKTSMAVQFD